VFQVGQRDDAASGVAGRVQDNEAGAWVDEFVEGRQVERKLINVNSG